MGEAPATGLPIAVPGAYRLADRTWSVHAAGELANRLSPGRVERVRGQRDPVPSGDELGPGTCPSSGRAHTTADTGSPRIQRSANPGSPAVPRQRTGRPRPAAPPGLPRPAARKQPPPGEQILPRQHPPSFPPTPTPSSRLAAPACRPAGDRIDRYAASAVMRAPGSHRARTKRSVSEARHFCVTLCIRPSSRPVEKYRYARSSGSLAGGQCHTRTVIMSTGSAAWSRRRVGLARRCGHHEAAMRGLAG